MNMTVTVFQVRKRVKNPGSERKRHTHNFLQFAYVFGGDGAVEIENMFFQAAPNDLYFIPMETEHELFGYRNFMTLHINFMCSPELMKKLKALQSYRYTLCAYEVSIIKDIINESVAGSVLSVEIINARVCELIFRTLRYSLQVNHTKANPDIENPSLREANNFQFILAYINDNIEKPLVIKELASFFSYSPAYFSSSFAKVVGCTPSRYIMMRKMERAKEMLLNTDLNITQVSEQVGFENLHYFSRVFKRYYGVSPKKFIALQLTQQVDYQIESDLSFTPKESDLLNIPTNELKSGKKER